MNDLPLPNDPRHQRFADRRIAGDTLVDAYLAAGFKADRKSSSNAKRIEARADVQRYMIAVRQASAKSTVLGLTEKREFLARIVRTPLISIDPSDPHDPNADIVRKFKRKTCDEGTKDDAETWIYDEFEKLDPLKAIDLDNKLSGDDPEANLMSQFAEALRGIAPPSPLPSGKM